MGPLGFTEILFILLLALLLFGPKRLPELGRAVGRGPAGVRRAPTHPRAPTQDQGAPARAGPRRGPGSQPPSRPLPDRCPPERIPPWRKPRAASPPSWVSSITWLSCGGACSSAWGRSEEHTSELQSRLHLAVCLTRGV